MKKHNRRTFLQTSAGAVALGASPVPAALITNAISANNTSDFLPQRMAPAVASNEGKKPLRLGLIVAIGKDPDAAIAKVRDLGLPTCQVFVSDFDLKDAPLLRQALDRHKIEATSFVVGGPGREVWDFYEGQLTIGLV
ncbi:MAG TPA: hypothetical protein VFI75_03075, partial [Candidatus Acidoferrum sp.]|nr:hypothetical protein [Candidatus Acidoferrum sp.]